jgi:hypothetical protein
MELEYDFEEMGHPIGGGWSFGSLSGKATIAYDSHGDWWIEDISVEISKFMSGEWRRHSYLLDKSKPREREHYHMLRSIINETERDAIQELVDEALPVTYERTSHISAGRTL